ncbi:iron ABC transporter permease [Yaniella flava]|uniref:Iron ABC transporter permease n=1 Tax=Yaniella flava TaxID=287930 RepID=A0ABP5GIB2_9MICC
MLTRFGWGAALAVVLTFLTIFFAWPVGAMLVRGITDDAGNLNLNTFGDVLTTGRTWAIVGHTLTMASLGTLGSVLFGIPAAYILYRTDFVGRNVLRSVTLIPFVLPTVVVGVAFRALLGTNGPLGFLGLDQTTWAVVAAMVFFNISLIARQVGGLWQMLDPRTVEAARSLGASRARAFCTITLPALTPAIGASAGLVFLYCSTAYSLVRTLGSPGVGTLETEVFRQTQAFLDLRTAAVFSALQVVFVLASVWLTQRLSHRTTTALRLQQPRRQKLSRADWLPLTITLFAVIVIILWPMVTLLERSLATDDGYGLDNYRLLLTSPGTGFAGGTTAAQALEHSVKIALDATVITLVAAILLSLVITRQVKHPGLARGQRLLDTFIMLPMGVSSVTIGFGFLVSLHAWNPSLSQSGMLVPLAQAVVALPLVVRSLIPVLAAVDPKQRQAAAVLGASPARVLATIDGPYILRAVGLAAGLSFSVSLGEFGATSFLASPEYQTLPIYIVRLLGRPGADNFGMALAAAVVLGIVASIALLLGERIRPRLRRFT